MAKERTEKGNGSVYLDKKTGKWVAEIKWTDNAGNKRRKRFTAVKQYEVKAKLKDFRKQLLLEQGQVESNVTLQEFAEYWMNSVLKGSLKPTSYQRKVVTFEHQVYPYIGHISVEQLTHTDIQGLVNKLSEEGLSYSTIKKAFDAIHGCIKYYQITNKKFFDPCLGVTLPENKRVDISDFVYFDQGEREAIKAEAIRKYSSGKYVYRFGNAIIFLMYTGLRIGELLALTWDDIDFEEKTVTVNKNAVMVKITSGDDQGYKLLNQSSTKTFSGTRIVPLSNIALEAITELKKLTGDMPYVMCSANGKQVNPTNIDRMFKRLLNNAGLSYKENCGVHSLRHTFATMLFSNGCQTKVVSELLGHSSTKITENIYIHVINKQKVKAIQNIDEFSV